MRVVVQVGESDIDRYIRHRISDSRLEGGDAVAHRARQWGSRKAQSIQVELRHLTERRHRDVKAAAGATQPGWTCTVAGKQYVPTYAGGSTFAFEATVTVEKFPHGDSVYAFSLG